MKRNRGFEILLLVLATLPLFVLAFVAIRIWLNGETEELNWQSSTWPLVFLQVVALIAYFVHLICNKTLTDGESGHWVIEFLLYQNIGMLIYWIKHVWDQPIRLRR